MIQSISGDYRQALAPMTEMCAFHNRWGKTALSFVGTFAFGAIQVGVSLPTAGICAIATAGLTYFTEKYYRETKSQNSVWTMTPRCSSAELKEAYTDKFGQSMVIASFIGPIQMVGYSALQIDVKMIAVASLVAPVAEEIVFRGVIDERCEDLLEWFGDHIYTLSAERIQLIKRVGGAILFGSIHIMGAQTVENVWIKGVVFISTASLGYHLSYVKARTRSLVPSICLHSVNNMGNIVGLVKWGIQEKIGTSILQYFKS